MQQSMSTHGFLTLETTEENLSSPVVKALLIKKQRFTITKVENGSSLPTILGQACKYMQKELL